MIAVGAVASGHFYRINLKVKAWNSLTFFPRYSIDRNTDLERFFNIEATTGVISTAKPLDREANAVHNITILAIESCEWSQIIVELVYMVAVMVWRAYEKFWRLH